MVPPATASDDVPAEQPEVAIDEATLYYVIRRAVEDAILGVIGTLLLVGLGLVLIWIGGAMAVSTDPETGVLPLVLGGAIALVGLYVAAATLRIIPPIREWF